MSGSWWRWPLLLTLALCLTGCLIIPTPHSDSGYARTNLDRHPEAEFMRGRTTREDVILTLGEPDAISRDEHELAYRSEKVMAWWILVAASPGGGGGATGGPIYRNRFYVFEFDPQGRYQSVKETGQWGIVQGADESLLSSPALKSASSNGVLATIAGQSVQHEYPTSFWLAGVDGFHSKGATSIVGQPGHLLCTESNLSFVTAFQFANAGPALTLPFASLSEVHLDRYFFGRRLVARLVTGEVHSFQIIKPGKLSQDKPAMQAACDFIQSKIKRARPGP